MILTKASLPRRTFLRGAGATVALPLLDAMVPALTAQATTAAAPVHRFGAFYVPNGMHMSSFIPATEGPGFALSPTLSPLQAFKDFRIVILGCRILRPNAIELLEAHERMLVSRVLMIELVLNQAGQLAEFGNVFAKQPHFMHGTQDRRHVSTLVENFEKRFTHV